MVVVSVSVDGCAPKKSNKSVDMEEDGLGLWVLVERDDRFVSVFLFLLLILVFVGRWLLLPRRGGCVKQSRVVVILLLVLTDLLAPPEPLLPLEHTTHHAAAPVTSRADTGMTRAKCAVRVVEVVEVVGTIWYEYTRIVPTVTNRNHTTHCRRSGSTRNQSPSTILYYLVWGALKREIL
jgi:hypothetical protein